MGPDGCKPDLSAGHIYIAGTEFEGEGLTDYDTRDFEEASTEYIKSNFVLKSEPASFTVSCVFNRIGWLKIIGIWDWVRDNCKLGRVRHLMKYGKNDRIRWKNFRRACRDVSKHMKEV